MKSDDYANLSPAARTVLVHALTEAGRMGHNEIAAAHLLFGLVLAKDDRVQPALDAVGITVEAVRNALAESWPHGARPSTTQTLASESAAAIALATSGDAPVTPVTLCRALLSSQTSATALLRRLGTTPAAILVQLDERSGVGERPTTHGLRARIGCAIDEAERAAARVDRSADEGDVVVALMSQRDSPLTRLLSMLAYIARPSRKRLRTCGVPAALD